MSKPTKPEWASNNPDQVIEPDSAKKQTGWLPGEKPPNQYFNWLLLKLYEWVNWTEFKTENIEPVIVRSDNPVSWDGSSLSFTSPLYIVFRTDDFLPQSNRFETSPLALGDGQVVVVKRETTRSNALLTEGTYGALVEGEYAIVDESLLTNDDAENETILFRRRDISASDDIYGIGYSILESPYTGQSIIGNSTFYLGGKVLSGREVINGEDLVFYSDDKATETARIDGATGNITTIGTVDGVDVSELVYQTVPTGSIIPFYDFNGQLTFNSSYWKYCNGQNHDFGGSIGLQTLPDLSNRYLVGFGTEGAGDIETASWDTSAVGNSSHEINLSHVHTVDSHTHDLGNHTHDLANHTHSTPNHSHSVNAHSHSVPAHYHGKGDLNITASGATDLFLYDQSSSASTITENVFTNASHSVSSSINPVIFGIADDHTHSNSYFSGSVGNTSGSNGDSAFNTDNSSPSTDSSGSGTTGTPSNNTSGIPSPNSSGSSSPSTNNQLSSAQSIQPRSVRVRFIMRVE